MAFIDLFTRKATAAVPVEATNVDAAAIAPYYSEIGNLFLFGGIVTASRAEAMSVPTCARALRPAPAAQAPHVRSARPFPRLRARE